MYVIVSNFSSKDILGYTENIETARILCAENDACFLEISDISKRIEHKKVFRIAFITFSWEDCDFAFDNDNPYWKCYCQFTKNYTIRYEYEYHIPETSIRYIKSKIDNKNKIIVKIYDAETNVCSLYIKAYEVISKYVDYCKSKGLSITDNNSAIKWSKIQEGKIADKQPPEIRFKKTGVKFSWYDIATNISDINNMSTEDLMKEADCNLLGVAFAEKQFSPFIKYRHGESQSAGVCSEELTFTFINDSDLSATRQAEILCEDYIEFCKENDLRIDSEESVSKWNELQT